MILHVISCHSNNIYMYYKYRCTSNHSTKLCSTDKRYSVRTLTCWRWTGSAMGKLTKPFLLSWIEVIFVTEPNSMSWRQERKWKWVKEIKVHVTPIEDWQVTKEDAPLINSLAVIVGSYSLNWYPPIAHTHTMCRVALIVCCTCTMHDKQAQAMK